MKNARLRMSYIGVFSAIAFFMLMPPINTFAFDENGYAVLPIIFCANKDFKVNKWQEFADYILVGEADEIKMNNLDTGFRENSCWVKFKVDESLKGNSTPNIWLRIIYSSYVLPYTGTHKDPDDLDNCPMKKGRKYLVFTKNSDYSSKHNPPFLMAEYSEKSNCLPLVELKYADEMLQKLRAPR